MYSRPLNIFFSYLYISTRQNITKSVNERIVRTMLRIVSYSGLIHLNFMEGKEPTTALELSA